MNMRLSGTRRGRACMETINGEEVALTLDAQPSSVMDRVAPFRAIAPDGNSFVFGYLVNDVACEYPLDDAEGKGRIYVRDAAPDMGEQPTFVPAPGCHQYGEDSAIRAGRIDVFVPLGVTRRDGAICDVFLLNGSAQQDIDVPATHCDAVWIPDRVAGQAIQQAASHRSMRDASRAYAREAAEAYTQWCHGDVYGIIANCYIKNQKGGWALNDSEDCYGVIGLEAAKSAMHVACSKLIVWENTNNAVNDAWLAPSGDI